MKAFLGRWQTTAFFLLCGIPTCVLTYLWMQLSDERDWPAYVFLAPLILTALAIPLAADVARRSR